MIVLTLNLHERLIARVEQQDVLRSGIASASGDGLGVFADVRHNPIADGNV